MEVTKGRHCAGNLKLICFMSVRYHRCGTRGFHFGMWWDLHLVNVTSQKVDKQIRIEQKC